MSEIEIILQENSKNISIKAKREMKFSELVNRFCKINWISKKNKCEFEIHF